MFGNKKLNDEILVLKQQVDRLSNTLKIERADNILNTQLASTYTQYIGAVKKYRQLYEDAQKENEELKHEIFELTTEEWETPLEMLQKQYEDTYKLLQELCEYSKKIEQKLKDEEERHFATFDELGGESYRLSVKLDEKDLQINALRFVINNMKNKEKNNIPNDVDDIIFNRPIKFVKNAK